MAARVKLNTGDGVDIKEAKPTNHGIKNDIFCVIIMIAVYQNN